jgi:hypothetical protein
VSAKVTPLGYAPPAEAPSLFVVDRHPEAAESAMEPFVGWLRFERTTMIIPTTSRASIHFTSVSNLVRLLLSFDALTTIMIAATRRNAKIEKEIRIKVSPTK